MQLEHIVVGMRPRTGWEAMDLGFALVRHAARDIYAAALVLMVPLAVAAIAVSDLSEPWLGVLLIWWMKPVLDAIVLSVLARALIGERTRVHATFTEAPRAIQGHLWGAMTVRRLSPSRTFTMPVRHLEGLTSKAARERIATLVTGRRGSAQLACFVCFGLDYALWLAGIQTVSMFVSSSSVISTSIFPENLPEAVFIAIVAGAVLVVEPVFAAIGFALYINRRVELEGWDLELAFRALKARAGRKPSKVAALVAGLMLTLLPMTATAQDAAIEERALVGPPASPAKAIKDILADADFDPWRPAEQWQPVEEEQEEAEAPDLADTTIPFASIGAILAKVLPWLLGVLGGVLVIHVLVLVLRSRTTVADMTPRLPHEGFDSLAHRREPVVGDVAALARAAWARGEQALALSILYRGAIAYFTEIDFPEGATEQECVALVRKKGVAPELVAAFTSIARAWQRCAYAHRLPTTDEIEALIEAYAKAFVRVESRVAA